MPGNLAFEDVQRACADGRCEDAVRLLERTVRQQPSNCRLYLWLGVCHSGCCGRSRLTDPDFALAYYRQALALAADADPLVRAAVLEGLASTCLRSRQLSQTEAVRTAIDCNRHAARIYAGCSKLDDWARQEFNLGNACCDLSEITGEGHWQEAISHYGESLKVRTREHDPERHAAVLENLGTAYRQLRSGDRLANLRKSVNC